MHIKNFDPYDFSKKEINGVPVYYKNLPWAPCVHIRIVFNVGAFNDPIGKEGTAHFLEHMMFQGCPSMEDEKAIKEFRKKYTLGSLNANTYYNRTIYNARTLPENFEKVLEGMKDMIFNSYFRETDIEHERQVITQESWRYFKNEKFLQYIQDVTKNLYHGHERNRNPRVLGLPDTIAKISQEDLIRFNKNGYSKENMFLVITGNFEESYLKIVETFLNNIPTGTRNEVKEGIISKPLVNRFVKTAEEIGDIREQLEFSLIRVTNKLPEQEEETLSQAQNLLQDILYDKLRIENSLCYSVSVSGRSYKTFFFTQVNLKTSEEKLELVEKEIWKTIQGISQGTYQEKFDIVHTMKLEKIKSMEYLSDDIANDATEDLVVNGKIDTITEYLDKAEKVTYPDVMALVKKTFDPECIFTEVILPSKK